MPDSNMNIDEFFRQQHQQLPAANSPDTDWAAMNKMLDRLPKHRWRKKTTRRIIQWMGGLALVTTVTYYAVKQTRQTKKIPVYTTTKQAAAPAQQPAAPLASSSSNSIATKPTVTKRLANPPKRSASYQRMIRQQSDTVLLETTIARSKPITSPAPVAPLVASTERNPAAVSNWLQQLASPPAVFEIDPQRDTVLVCPQGTVVWVPSHTFIAEGASPYPIKDPVQITVKECYRYADMLANRLSTTTANDVLTTGGMLQITATTDKKNVRSYLNRPLRIEMPYDRYDPTMQLYLPDRQLSNDSSQAFNWQPAGQQQAYVTNIPFIERTNIKLLQVQQRVDRDGKKEMAHFDVQPEVPLTEPQIKALLRQRYPFGPEKMSISVSERAGPMGSLKGSRAKATKQGFVMTDSVSISFAEALRKKLLRPVDSLAFIQLRRQDSIVWRQRVLEDSLAFIKVKEFRKTYSFNTNNLGWVNCDRIIAPDLPRATFVINSAFGEAPSMGLYHLIFTNQKAIIAGTLRNGEIYFGNMPQGLTAKLICIIKQGDKVMSYVKAIRIVDKATVEMEFTETDPEKFKQQLAAMDAALVN